MSNPVANYNAGGRILSGDNTLTIVPAILFRQEDAVLRDSVRYKPD